MINYFNFNATVVINWLDGWTCFLRARFSILV